MSAWEEEHEGIDIRCTALTLAVQLGGIVKTQDVLLRASAFEQYLRESRVAPRKKASGQSKRKQVAAKD